jgi:hypothetical protein
MKQLQSKAGNVRTRKKDKNFNLGTYKSYNTDKHTCAKTQVRTKSVGTKCIFFIYQLGIHETQDPRTCDQRTNIKCVCIISMTFHDFGSRFHVLSGLRHVHETLDLRFENGEKVVFENK